MSQCVLLNGDFVRSDLASVGVQDKGFLHGAGLFETMVARAGRVWRIERHLERMRRSADALHLALPPDFDRLPAAASELLERNNLTDARIRLTVTAGSASPEEAPAGRPTSLLAAGPHRPYPDELYDRGMTVLISSQRQDPSNPCTGHKTVSYFPRLLALHEAHGSGCQEALLFTPDHRLAEACVSNVFLVKDGQLRTPPLETPVLPGITRQAVLELAGPLSVETRETALTINELLAADEVFLTSVGLGAMPVCRIERHAVGDEKPGRVTRRVSEALAELIRAETHG